MAGTCKLNKGNPFKGVNWMDKTTKWALISLTVLLAVDLLFFVGYMMGWKFLLFLL